MNKLKSGHSMDKLHGMYKATKSKLENETDPLMKKILGARLQQIIKRKKSKGWKD